MRYYEIELEDERSWLLAEREKYQDGSPVDIWIYGEGERINSPKSLPLEIYKPGLEMDYNETPYSNAIISKKVGKILNTISPNEIQLIPAVIDGIEEKWDVLNVISIVDCVDREKSMILYHSDDDSDCPGKPRMILSLTIDPEKAEGYHIFKIPKWRSATIVSEDLARAFKDAGVTGITSFQAVVEPWQK